MKEMMYMMNTHEYDDDYPADPDATDQDYVDHPIKAVEDSDSGGIFDHGCIFDHSDEESYYNCTFARQFNFWLNIRLEHQRWQQIIILFFFPEDFRNTSLENGIND